MDPENLKEDRLSKKAEDFTNIQMGENYRLLNEELLQQREELSILNRALLDSEKRMNRSQEIAHLGSWELDILKNHLFWSDEVYRIFGLKPQEFDATYEAFLEAIHPDDREAVDEAYTGSLREGRDTYEIEHRIIRKDTGEIRIVHEKCEHFRNELGNIFHSVGMVHDITETKQAEAELTKYREQLEKLVEARTSELEDVNESLKESKEHYLTLFNSIDEGFCTIEVIFDDNNKPIDYRFLEINPAFEKQTGLKEARGKLMRNLEPDLEEHWFEIYGKIALTGKPERFVNEAKQLNKWYDVYAFKIGAPESRKVAIIFNDITKFKNVESELIEYQNTLEEKVKTRTADLAKSNAELEQFAYITSHDLREPLRMITSFLQLLERRYKDQLDKDANEFIKFAVDGAKRLDSMTNDLLEYSKITSEKREDLPVNFEHILEEALINLKVSIEENNAIITHGPLPTIKGDKQLMVQLFQNLIGNSIKYRSQETPKIIISAIREKNKYLFSIKDNGIGISSKHLERIFTIFKRLHTREEYEGTGIGLAIAQKIVYQHGGEIWAESELGKGTTFYFTIPI